MIDSAAARSRGIEDLIIGFDIWARHHLDIP